MATTATGRHGSKTRTACLTCRQRKVKCGEERPYCRRCIKAGRTCEGYQMLLIDGAASIINQARAAPQLNSSNMLLSAFTATQDEWQAYRFYTQQISTTLGGSVDTDLWQKLVIQISNDDAAVRNGVFSLGNLFRHRFDGSNSHISMCSCARCVQALRSYNKAIASFANRSARIEEPVPLNTALASCALFICIEYYRKNDRNAIALIDKGCGMLVEYLRRSQDIQTSGIEPRLLSLFARLRVLSASFSHVVHWPLSPRYTVRSAPKGIHEPFARHLEDARSSLYEIMTDALRSRRHCAEALIRLWPSRTSRFTIEDLRHERDLVASRLRRWNEKFVELQADLNSELPESSTLALILHAHFQLTMIYTETSLELSQDCYNNYFAEFKSIADAAEIGLGQLSIADQINHFSFESCFLGMLYLAALKCREPTMRRKLAELIPLCREKEGLWHRGESITVVSRVVEPEEGRSEFIPSGDEHIGTVVTAPYYFHDVWCEVNYVSEGKTMVDATYILHREHSEHEWLTMKETLIVNE